MACEGRKSNSKTRGKKYDHQLMRWVARRGKRGQCVGHLQRCIAFRRRTSGRKRNCRKARVSVEEKMRKKRQKGRRGREKKERVRIKTGAPIRSNSGGPRTYSQRGRGSGDQLERDKQREDATRQEKTDQNREKKGSECKLLLR